MIRKRIVPFLPVLLAFALLLAACGNGAPVSADPAPDTPPGEDAGLIPWEEVPVSSTIGPVPDGAVDFSDGKTGFLAFNLAPGDADPAVLSVIPHNGGSALKVEVTENNNPYLGIDVSGLYGGRVSDVRKIEMRIWTEHPDGNFHAASGHLEVYTGRENQMAEYIWAVAMEKNNPMTLTVTLDGEAAFVPGAQNILILRKAVNGDNAVRAGEHAANIIIGYIACYDASGNIIPADTSASFDGPAGFGSADTSFLFAIADEVKLGFTDDNKTGVSPGGWGQGGALDKGSLLDVGLLRPGSVITVGYAGPEAPEIIFQSWPESSAPDTVTVWAKVNPFTVNGSGTLAQYRYEDCAEAFGSDDFEAYLDRVYIGDRGERTEIKSFSIGQRADDVLFTPNTPD